MKEQKLYKNGLIFTNSRYGQKFGPIWLFLCDQHSISDLFFRYRKSRPSSPILPTYEDTEEEGERGLKKDDKYWLVLETPAERRSRLVSLYIVHSAMLVFSLGFSIVLTGRSLLKGTVSWGDMKKPRESVPLTLLRHKGKKHDQNVSIDLVFGALEILFSI